MELREIDFSEVTRVPTCLFGTFNDFPEIQLDDHQNTLLFINVHVQIKLRFLAWEDTRLSSPL